jgi:hypothetical protein
MTRSSVCKYGIFRRFPEVPAFSDAAFFMKHDLKGVLKYTRRHLEPATDHYQHAKEIATDVLATPLHYRHCQATILGNDRHRSFALFPHSLYHITISISRDGHTIKVRNN